MTPVRVRNHSPLAFVGATEVAMLLTFVGAAKAAMLLVLVEATELAYGGTTEADSADAGRS